MVVRWLAAIFLELFVHRAFWGRRIGAVFQARALSWDSVVSLVRRRKGHLVLAAELPEVSDLAFFFGVGGVGPVFAFVFGGKVAAIV